MTPIPFFKMSGAGNDFIVIDNRQAVVDENGLETFIARVCRRKLSVGADGLILIENADDCDFKWRFFNSDGSTAEMCGNGARCAARFAYVSGIAGEKLCFDTLAGKVEARILDDRVSLRMTDPVDLDLDQTLALKQGALAMGSINTGVPHAVVQTENIEEVDVTGLGREIRFHPHFAPAGTNANFFSIDGPGRISVRTYERGVEDETLACGTGAVACALITALRHGAASPIEVRTRSGEPLVIHFHLENGVFRDVRLEGGARIVYTAELQPEAWQ